MTLLQNPRANPGLARLMFRRLALTGGRLDRATLFATVAPAGAGDYDPERKPDGDARDETYTVCRALGLFDDDGADVVLCVPEAAWPAGDSLPAFRTLVRRQLFDTTAGRDPFDAGAGLAVFTGALAWFLTHDPLRPFHGWAKSARGRAAEDAQADGLAFANRLIKNDPQWEAFVRWAGFLGFLAEVRLARTIADAVVPDPAVAIADEVADLGEAPANAWLAQLATTLPVLDGGATRVAVEARLRPEAVPPPVSPALSIALERLRAEGRLRLLDLSDAAPETRVVLHLGDDERPVSTIKPGAPDD